MSLADLCAICHVNPIKYTCPRDGVHTCSLSCVKRHKQWAQCSGIRDPAEYRKRSELATPSSIDKDFNFITKIERTLSRAETIVANTGIDLVPARLKQKDARSKLDIELEARHIKIIRAPKGLSRSKQNRTTWGGQPKCVVWTTEWLCHDGQKLISGANETKSVKELFDLAQCGRRSSRKRKRPSDTIDPPQERSETNADQSKPSRQLISADQGPQPRLMNVSTDQKDEKSRGEDVSILHTISDNTIASNPEQSIQPMQSSNQYFYLHRPQTDSRFKCLIPLSPDAPLQELLDHKTLIEFPTIYVRSEPPDRLQPPFITEHEYNQRHGADIPINLTMPAEATADAEDLDDGEVSSPVDFPSSINEKKILEVLADDLGS